VRPEGFYINEKFQWHHRELNPIPIGSEPQPTVSPRAPPPPPPLPFVADKPAAAEVLLVEHPYYMPFSGSTEMTNIHWPSSCIEQAAESKPTVKTLSTTTP